MQGTNRTVKALAAGLALIGLAGTASAQERRVIATPNAPQAIGPYSNAIATGGMVFLAGQIPLDPKTNQLNQGPIEEQTKQVLENLKAVLEASGLSMRNVVKVFVFMKDLNEFSRMNAVYATYFPESPPARATVQVARLPRDAGIEISMIAAR